MLLLLPKGLSLRDRRAPLPLLPPTFTAAFSGPAASQENLAACSATAQVRFSSVPRPAPRLNKPIPSDNCSLAVRASTRERFAYLSLLTEISMCILTAKRSEEH